mmetsp:Transcript_13886/g.40599  ORF Transcript_13886/g.40599 Transcript_13886/m.40599 type:complete len:1190 (-) Transcript_13886:39-3608(-)
MVERAKSKGSSNEVWAVDASASTAGLEATRVTRRRCCSKGMMHSKKWVCRQRRHDAAPIVPLLLVLGLATCPSRLLPRGVLAQPTVAPGGGVITGVEALNETMMDVPSAKPTAEPIQPTHEPTGAPTTGPSGAPTPGPSGAPTPGPSGAPTPGPSGAPTPGPTYPPTVSASPSETPSFSPSLAETSEIKGRYEQDLEVTLNSDVFDENQQDIFESLMANYTLEYGPGKDLGVNPSRITTSCKITSQSILGGAPVPAPTSSPTTSSPTTSAAPVAQNALADDIGGGGAGGVGAEDGTGRWLRGVGEKLRNTQYFTSSQRALTLTQLRLGYELTWTSNYVAAKAYVEGFSAFVNKNLTRITNDIQNAGLSQVKEAKTVLTVRTTPPPTPKPTTPPPTHEPTVQPTFAPTISHQPTTSPTDEPSDAPSGFPTEQPSSEPTNAELSKAEAHFEHDLYISTDKAFDIEEKLQFETVMAGYAPLYGPRKGIEPLRVDTRCVIESQKVLKMSRVLGNVGAKLKYSRYFTSSHEALLSPFAGVGEGQRRRRTEVKETSRLRLTYRMTWVSNYTDVENYKGDFSEFINDYLVNVTEDLNGVGLEQVVGVDQALELNPTPFPTAGPTLPATPIPSPVPTPAPSQLPTRQPTSVPTSMPSPLKTEDPTHDPTPAPEPEKISTNEPTMPPTVSTLAPVTFTPAAEPDNGGDGLSTGAISGLAAGSAAVLILFVVWLFRRRSKEKDSAFNRPPGRKQDIHNPERRSRGQSANGTRGPRPPPHLPPDHDRVDVDVAMEQSTRGAVNTGGGSANGGAAAAAGLYKYPDDRREGFADEPDDLHDVDQDLPQDDSLVSNQSLLSAGRSMSSDSGHEDDARDFLADEFDQIKDQNLEKMRTEVEGTVTNVDGMMSQALLKALMDDEDTNRDMNELTWGGSRTSIEIEASVLCEMNDWLKRKEGAGLDERRGFMQETLNKMVASVRHGIVEPEEASRTIHECAAMLGLQLAENIPETALIVTGMRKTVGTEEMIVSFKEFGDIEGASVSPNQRGFGLVRYRSPKSVLRAIDRFKTAEIVVQDVAVMIRVLKSEGGSISKEVQYSGSNRQSAKVEVGRSSAAASRGTGMEAHHGANLETIGYPGNSFGGPSGAVAASRGYPRPGSDTGSARSGRSRTSSSRGHQHGGRKGSSESNEDSYRGNRRSSRTN